MSSNCETQKKKNCNWPSEQVKVEGCVADFLICVDDQRGGLGWHASQATKTCLIKPNKKTWKKIPNFYKGEWTIAQNASKEELALLEDVRFWSCGKEWQRPVAVRVFGYLQLVMKSVKCLSQQTAQMFYNNQKRFCLTVVDCAWNCCSKFSQWSVWSVINGKEKVGEVQSNCGSTY